MGTPRTDPNIGIPNIKVPTIVVPVNVAPPLVVNVLQATVVAVSGPGVKTGGPYAFVGPVVDAIERVY